MGVARRILRVVFALALLLAGLGLLAVGAGLVWFFGPDGTYRTSGDVTKAGRVVAGDTTLLSGLAPSALEVRKVRLAVEGRDPARIAFVGIGPADQVEAYLQGVASDRVIEVGRSPLRLDTTPGVGDRAPGAPAEQPFWVAKAAGVGRQEIVWDVDEGAFGFVVMNADGAPVVDQKVEVGLEVPWAFPVGLVSVLIGLLALLFSISVFTGGPRTSTTTAAKPTKKQQEAALQVNPNVPDRGRMPTPLGGARGPTP